jgi:hypothetical protein
MTYYDTVIKDTPIGLWRLDGDFVDATGRGANATNTGAFVRGIPLVDGPTQSFRSDSGGSTITVPFAYAQAGQEDIPFSVEVWYYSKATNAKIMAHGGTNTDGINLVNGAIQFSVRLSTGLVSVSWKPPFLTKHHVVGVYTGSSIELYVDGEVRAKYEFSDAEKAAPFALTEASNVLTHNTLITLQAIATYNFALPIQAIKRHWQAGNRCSGTSIARQLYAGRHIDLSTRTANILSQKFWNEDNWNLGFSTATTGTKLSSAVDDAGVYLSSYWTDTFELEGSDGVDGVQLEYEGQGVFTVEASIDGVTWAVVPNGKRVPAIFEGSYLVNKILSIRVTFTAGSYGEVSWIHATGFRDRTVFSPPMIPVTRPANSLVYPDKEMNLLDERSGIELVGSGSTLSIGPNSEEGALPVKSLGFWYYVPTGGAFTSIGFTATVVYENGVAVTPATKFDRWFYLVYTNTAGYTNPITIVGNQLKIAHITLWEETLTAAQVANIFKSFTGYPTIKSTSVDSMGVITDPDASIYANDWSISKAGV